MNRRNFFRSLFIGGAGALATACGALPAAAAGERGTDELCKATVYYPRGPTREESGWPADWYPS